MKYGERLGKALHEIAAPEPAPAGVAGFLDQMPLQQGNLRRSSNQWQTVGARNRIRTGTRWPLTIDTSEAISDVADDAAGDTPSAAAAVAQCAPVEVPPSSQRWMNAPPPEPVAAFVRATAALAPAHRLSILRFAAEVSFTPCPDLAPGTPSPCVGWMPAPAPEPVAAFVQASSALTSAHRLSVPHFAAELEPTAFLDLALGTPARCEGWMSAPAAEPVAAFVQASSALTPAHRLSVPHFAAELEPTAFLDLALGTPARCDGWMSAPAAEPVAAFVQASSALNHAHRLSIPHFTVELEPTPLLDLALGTPARCDGWMPAPAPEPVAAFVQASSALIPARRLPVPRFAGEVEPAAQYVPWIAQARPVPHVEAVMTTVRPTASAQQVSIRQVAAIALRLPAIPQASQELFGAASAASAPAPEAVERLLVAAEATVPVSIGHEPGSRGVDLGAPLPVLESAPDFCRPVASPAPEPLESLLVPSVATPVKPAAGVRLPAFLLAVSQGRSLTSFAAQRLAPAASRPPAAVPRLEAPRPIATPVVTPPPAAGQPLELALPHPGLLPIEFHSHRLRSAAAPRAEWCTPRPALLPPRFLLRPIVEKAEEPVPHPKAARKEPGFVDVLTMPGAKRQPSVWEVAGKVAAGFFLAAGVWYGVANFRVDRQLTAREVSSGDAGLSASDSATSASLPSGGTAGKPTPGGPVAWVRQTIADRASLKLAENFRGLENWEGDAKARPVGWLKHPDGYVKAGALALFRPSLKFKDYHMEFFGQIEAKSIGWTVRATDTMNYHAMKLSVVEAGMRPFVALVHYNVVDGKSGHRTQTPLNIMVHNNRPMQFAVDVRGTRVVTSIDGEEVDSFIDNTLVAGGVGFFSEEGERARLYWMSVSRNDDWLGRVCAMLAEGAGVERTAWLGGPELPGGAPAPGLPAQGDGKTLAAVWFGLPYLGATRKARFLKTWRSEPWNT